MDRQDFPGNRERSSSKVAGAGAEAPRGLRRFDHPANPEQPHARPQAGDFRGQAGGGNRRLESGVTGLQEQPQTIRFMHHVADIRFHLDEVGVEFAGGQFLERWSDRFDGALLADPAQNGIIEFRAQRAHGGKAERLDYLADRESLRGGRGRANAQAAVAIPQVNGDSRFLLGDHAADFHPMPGAPVGGKAEKLSRRSGVDGEGIVRRRFQHDDIRERAHAQMRRDQLPAIVDVAGGNPHHSDRGVHEVLIGRRIVADRIDVESAVPVLQCQDPILFRRGDRSNDAAHLDPIVMKLAGGQLLEVDRPRNQRFVLGEDGDLLAGDSGEIEAGISFSIHFDSLARVELRARFLPQRMKLAPVLSRRKMVRSGSTSVTVARRWTG